MLRQRLLGTIHRTPDLMARLVNVLLRKPVIGLEPFLALGRYRDFGQRFFEFFRSFLAHDRPDALRPSDGRDGMKQMFVDDLAPTSHARTPERIRRLERRI